MQPTGRGNWPRNNKKETVENCRRLNVNSLATSDFFSSNNSGKIIWADGSAISHRLHARAGSDSASCSAVESLEISFCWSSRLVIQHIPLQFTKSTFGNRRWFLCPGKSNQEPCLGRCAMLYLCDGKFACRICHNLAYESQRESRVVLRLLHAAGLGLLTQADIRDWRASVN